MGRTSSLACQACRRLKRKCTRELPTCSLCARLEKPCRYPGLKDTNGGEAAGSGSMESSPTLQSPMPPAGPPERFPTSYFLDPNFFRPLPAGALVSTRGLFESRVESCLGPDIDAICRHFFSTVHAWLPMLSKKRLLHLVKNSHAPREESQSLLLLCMKLASGMGRHGGTARDSPVYRLAKSSCSASEQGGFLSLRLIQSMVLVAVYEVGNAVFPEAYLTIGQASRLGGLMSLHNKELAPQLFQPADTWTLREEQRRTWWAIFVLDKRVARKYPSPPLGDRANRCSRYITINTPFLPHSVQDLCLDSLLPVNDIDWNEGAISANESLLTTSFHSASNLGTFARTCQAAHVMSKVLKHRDHRLHTPQDREDVLTEALALHALLVALENSLSPPSPHGTDHTSGGMENALALSLSASARLVLYRIYACNEHGAGYARGRIALETEMQRHAIAGVKDICLRVAPLIASTIDHDIGTSGSTASPLLSSVLYHAATECGALIREDFAPDMYQALGDVVGGMRRLATDWQVAGGFLNGLVRHEYADTAISDEFLALLEKGGVLGFLQGGNT